MGGLEADAGGMSFGVWDREEFGSVVTYLGPFEDPVRLCRSR